MQEKPCSSNEEELRAYCELNNFGTTQEAIEYIQFVMDSEKQVKRLIKDTVGDFRNYITRHYFDYPDHALVEKMMPKWIKFFSDSDKVWRQDWDAIQDILNSNALSSESLFNIQVILDRYQEKIHVLWDVFSMECENENMDLAKELPRMDLSANVYTILGLTPKTDVV